MKRLNLQHDVWMPGFVQNPYSYISQANLFVLSSKWEGLPNVLIEAIGLGVPVISTRCPSGADEILGNGLFGKLVAVGDDQALCHAMECSLSGVHPQFDQSMAISPFDLPSVVNQYLKVLRVNCKGNEFGDV